MAEFLNQDEIDALLNIADKDEDFEENSTNRNNYSIVDFNKPNYISSDQIKGFNNLHDKMLRPIITQVSTMLRKIVDIRIYSIEQMSFAEFILSIPQITAITEASLNNKKIVMECNPGISHKIIGNLLGGDIGFLSEESDMRELTNLELTTFKYFEKIIFKELENSWSEIEPSIITTQEQYTNRNVIQTTTDQEKVILAVLEITIDDISGFLTICYPVSHINDLLQKMEQKMFPEKEKIEINIKRRTYKALGVELYNKDIQLNNTITIEKEFFEENSKELNIPNIIKYNEILNEIKLSTKKEVLKFKRSLNNSPIKDSISLNHKIDELFEISINNSFVGYGEFIKLDESYGFNIKKINENYEEITNNIKNKFLIIKFNETLYICQENRALFKLKEISNNQFKLINIEENELC